MNASPTTGNSNIWIHGPAVIDGNKDNQGVGYWYGILFVKVSDSKVEYVTFQDIDSVGVEISSGAEGTDHEGRNEVNHCVFLDCGYYSIHFYHSLKNRAVENYAARSGLYNYYVERTHDCVVANNVAENATEYNYFADVNATHNSFIGNVGRYATLDNFRAQNNCNWNTWTGNIAIGAKQHNYALHTSHFCTLNGNQSYTANQSGCWLWGSTENTISGLISMNNSQGPTNTWGGINFTGDGTDGYSANNTVIGCVLSDNQSVATQRWGYREGSASDNNNIVVGNVANGNATGAIGALGSGTIVRSNKGYVTEASGTATILSGATVIAVTHGLSLTPDESKIALVPLEDPTNTPGAIGVANNATSTTFWIFCENDPGASNLDIGWTYQN